MPRTDVPVNNITRDGVLGAEVNGDPANQHSFLNDGRTFLVVRNAGAVSRNLTLRLGRTVDGQAPANKVVVLAAGVTRFFGPFYPSDYNDRAEGSTKMFVDVDNADLKLTAYRLP